MKVVWAFCLAAVLMIGLSSCGVRRVSEPEDVYLVSAIGFDREGELLRLSAEVPLTRENEADKMEVKCFAGIGETPERALLDLRSGLSKELIFGHCALIVLGDTLAPEDRSIATDFAAHTVEIPLSVPVISTPDAFGLLRNGSLSAPAAGYDIPEILRRQNQLYVLDLRCRLYEILAGKDGNQILPRFLPVDSEQAASDSFDGLQYYEKFSPVGERNRRELIPREREDDGT